MEPEPVAEPSPAPASERPVRAAAQKAAQKASELHKIWVMSEVDDRTGASAGCAEVDGEVGVWLREAAEAEVSAAALRVLWAMCLACDAACLPFGMVGELRRKLSPIALAVLLLFMGVGIMNIRVSAEFPCLRQRAAFCSCMHPRVKRR